jgi:hypothetical protein
VMQVNDNCYGIIIKYVLKTVTIAAIRVPSCVSS